MNEIKKSIQDVKEEINEDIEILKNNQSKGNNSISQMKLQLKLGKQSGGS
jgi:hypothetical protein